MILARTDSRPLTHSGPRVRSPSGSSSSSGIVNKGIDTGRFDMCHVETDRKPRSDSQRRRRYQQVSAFARDENSEAVTPYVEDRSDGMLLFTLSTIARLLCGRPFDAAGRAVSGIG